MFKAMRHSILQTRGYFTTFYELLKWISMMLQIYANSMFTMTDLQYKVCKKVDKGSAPTI